MHTPSHVKGVLVLAAGVSSWRSKPCPGFVRGSRAPGVRDSTVMRDDIHHWAFVAAPNHRWNWHLVLNDGNRDLKSPPFYSFAAATAHATIKGFDPCAHLWTATVNGRTTHYRPGRNPINLPAGEEPPP